MSTSTGTASVQELNATFGVLLIGFIFAVTLYGLTFFRTSVHVVYDDPSHSVSCRDVHILLAIPV